MNVTFPTAPPQCQAAPPIPQAPPLADAILRKFCEPNKNCDRLSTPFVVGERRYASDGKVGIRIPCEEPDTDRATPTASSLAGVFTPLPEDGVYLPWPRLPKCAICSGSGLNPKCDCSYGQRACSECGTPRKCRKCDGTGTLGDTCEACRLEQYSVLNYCRIAHHYICLISQLPEVEFLVCSERRDCVRFRFTGGDGVVMEIVAGQ